GAIVVLEAPCDIQLLDENHVKLTRGRLVGRCPTAESKGFIVDTPNARIIDLGTEFGVHVDDRGVSEAHVFDGEIELTALASGKASQPARELAEGNAVRVNQIGTSIQAKEIRPLAFVRGEEFDARIKAETSPYHRWLAHSYALRRDPSLIAYYAFDKSADGVLVESRGDRAFDGDIRGAEWVEGRFPWKHGLRFGGPGSKDRVELSAVASKRMDFQGSFSIAVWFKSEPFTSDWQSVISKGDNHWRVQRNTLWDRHPQIHSDRHEPSALNFGHDDISYADVPDLPGRTPVDDGTWHQVVIVYEANSRGGVKYLYVDGVADADSIEVPPLLPDEDESRVWIGGNSVKSKDREFHGVIDEVAIYERALTPDQIGELYRAGKPLQ
ncbi:MAG: FecR domain-containing protein, partial [Rhodospirillales bacterium]|nr:FecR domain-containing protein [Rhodospirillales bacterium]